MAPTCAEPSKREGGRTEGGRHMVAERGDGVDQQAEVEHHLPIPDRKVDIRLPGQGNSNFHGARPVH